MERLQFYLEPELNEELERLARSIGVSKAQLIREGIRKVLSERQPVEEEPLLKLIGLAKKRTGRRDVAAKHDYYLYGEGTGNVVAEE